ncbi:MAG: dTDP-4-dehydrorhamnose 3,5-epimerase [Elusimicrobia bacterium]|nr:dTDP-4-dehydrorhamnose 3,5-epimerase [Elusimicrobiota bacterium]
MKFTPTDIPGLVFIEPHVFRDERGFFFENYHQKKFAQAGIQASFVQDNHSRSVKGTLRGLHFQMSRPQAKLVRVLSGEIFDVVVDLRAGSPTFKKWQGFTLSSESFTELFVPVGLAHGFVTLSEQAEVEYKVTDFYDKNDEGGIIWNDPEIGIAWPISHPLLSPKDERWTPFKDISSILINHAAYKA